MSFCTFVMFAAFELEDDDLRAATVLDHGRGDARAGYRGRADSDAVGAAGDQDLVEFDLIPFILIGQRGDANDISGTYTELFSTCAYNCVRHFFVASDFSSLRKPPIIGGRVKRCQLGRADNARVEQNKFLSEGIFAFAPAIYISSHT